MRIPDKGELTRKGMDDKEPKDVKKAYFGGGGIHMRAKIRPINRQIYVRKCTTGVRVESAGDAYYIVGNVIVPDTYGDSSHWAEILDVADDCVLFNKTHIGGFVRLAEWKPRHMRSVIPEKEFIVKEQLFEDELMPVVWKPKAA